MNAITATYAANRPETGFTPPPAMNTGYSSCLSVYSAAVGAWLIESDELMAQCRSALKRWCRLFGPSSPDLITKASRLAKREASRNSAVEDLLRARAERWRNILDQMSAMVTRTAGAAATLETSDAIRAISGLADDIRKDLDRLSQLRANVQAICWLSALHEISDSRQDICVAWGMDGNSHDGEEQEAIRHHDVLRALLARRQRLLRQAIWLQEQITLSEPYADHPQMKPLLEAMRMVAGPLPAECDELDSLVARLSAQPLATVQ